MSFTKGFEKVAYYYQTRTARGPKIKMRESTRKQMDERSKKRHAIGGTLATAGGAGLGKLMGKGKGALIGAAVGAGGSLASRAWNKRKIKKAKTYSGKATEAYNFGESGRKRLGDKLRGKYIRHIQSKGKDIDGFEAD